MAKNQNYFYEKSQAIERLKQSLKTLNREIAIEAINFYKESFDNQGFTDKVLIPWRKTKSGKLNRFAVKSHGILIQSGELRDSFDYRISGNVITIINYAKHAQIHNKGGTINHPGGTAFFPDKKGEPVWVSNRKAKELQALRGLKLPRTKAHPIKIPKRQFMGASAVLNERIKKIIINKLIWAIYIKK